MFQKLDKKLFITLRKWCYGVIVKRGDFMAYFLKKSNLKKGTYLQIYESFYDSVRRGTAHRSYKAIGYVHELIDSGIADPVSHYKKEITKLNQHLSDVRQKNKAKQISDETPEKLLGYFPLKNINDSLSTKKYIDLMQTATNLKFNVFSMISALVYSRALSPCSKSKTFDEVLPRLFDYHDFSLSQIYSGLEYIGSEYEKIIEIYNHQINLLYPFDTSHTYFDCTNFYFEIDKEDTLRRKGPSKENRREPIVGMGLLLDSRQIPIGMKIYPGNESEKPIIRSIIDELKGRNNILGRTIQVADKGLNCSANIVHALKAGDGYIFSKSVKQLPEIEKTWVLLQNDYRDIKSKNGEMLYQIKECIDDFPYTYTDEYGKRKTIKIREKRVVTFNPKLAKKQIFEINRQIEKAQTLKACQAKKSEYGDSAKYVSFVVTDEEGVLTNDKVNVIMNEGAIKKALKLAGYNLIVTSEVHMAATEIYSAYHNLWRIEESFKIMKSQLDARPVYLQKEETIIGHFLICYLSVLLTRILQFNVLGNSYSSEDIFNFIRQFKAAQISDKKFLNLTKTSSFIKEFSTITNLPLTSYFLSEAQIKKMLSHRF
jgi:Transposase